MHGRPKAFSLALAAGTLSMSAVATAVPAEVPPLSSEFHIDPANPEASVPTVAARNAKPLEFGYFIQDLVTSAEAAGRSGDHQAEARYYSAFTKAVPDSGVGFSRLCASLEAGGRREEAVAACRRCLGLPGVALKDYVRFVHLVLARRGDLTPEEREDVQQIALHLRERPQTRVAGDHLQCELGVRVESVSLLEDCTADLTRLAPRDPKTTAFAWALAVRKNDVDGAQRLIARARTTGIGTESIARMERATRALAHGWRRLLFGWWTMLGAAVVALGCGALFFFRYHQRSSSKAPRSNPAAC